MRIPMVSQKPFIGLGIFFLNQMTTECNLKHAMMLIKNVCVAL